MKDISFDLETLGTRGDAMILSIGAVKFDRDTGELGDTFYQVIDIEHPLGGGTIDASTVKFWMRQSDAARNEVFSDDEQFAQVRAPLRDALVNFSYFIGFTDELEDGEFPDVMLWQRGDKDSQWLTSAYEGMQLAQPYGWWQVSDERTLSRLFKPLLPARTGTHHNALDDAVYQAQCICNIFARLGSVGAFVHPVVPPTRLPTA